MAANSAQLRNKAEKLENKGEPKKGMVSPEKSDNENVPPEARGIVKAVKNKNVGCKEKEHIKKLRPLQSKVSLNDGEIFLM